MLQQLPIQKLLSGQNLGERNHWCLIKAVHIGSPQTKHDLFYEKYIQCFPHVTTSGNTEYNSGGSELPALSADCAISIPR